MTCSQNLTSKKYTPEWYFQRALKPPKAFFDWCYSHIPTYHWENKSKTILSSDRTGCEVIKKRLTKRSNLNFYVGFYSFAIILVTSKRIEIQSYAFWSNVKEGVQSVDWEFCNMEQFANNQHIQVTKQRKTYYFGLTANYSSLMSSAYQGTQFYKNNWQCRLQEISELKHLDVNVNHWRLIAPQYKYRQEIEFLQKIGATKMADEVSTQDYTLTKTGARKSVDMRTVNKKWLKKHKVYLKQSNQSFFDYQLQEKLRKLGVKAVPGIEDYLTYRDIEKIPKGVGLVKFQNWIIKNKVKFSYYADYLNLLHELYLDPTNNMNLILPKDVVKAHDNCVELLNQMKVEIENRQYDKRLKEILCLEKQIDDILFVVPKDLNEILQEGKALHHCVGGEGYIKAHRQGETTIVFIRKATAPLEPYFTLQLTKNRIIQIQGKHNREMIPKEINQVSQEWLDHISKKAS